MIQLSGKSGVLAACLLLASCASAPPATVEVKVPVIVPCVTVMPARPVFAYRGLAPDASDGEVVLALARDTPLHLKYESELEAALAGCQ